MLYGTLTLGQRGADNVTSLSQVFHIFSGKEPVT